MTDGQNLGAKKQSAAFHVKGIDSYRFLNGMLTQDIQKTSEHLPSGARSFFLTNKGKIIAPLFFTSLNQEEVFLWTDEGSAEALHQGLERYLIADKAEITAAGTFSSWSLIRSEFKSEPIKTRHPQGLEKITTTSVSNTFIALPLGVLSTEHTEVICLKDEFQATEMSKEDYWEACSQAGQPQWGIDLFADDFFLEFPLSDAVSFDKGCYMGQETVARGTFRGKVNKSFCRITSDKILSRGEILTSDGTKVGSVRSVLQNKGTGIIKFNLNEANTFLINGETHTLKIEHLVNEETYRKGR